MKQESVLLLMPLTRHTLPAKAAAEVEPVEKAVRVVEAPRVEHSGAPAATPVAQPTLPVRSPVVRLEEAIEASARASENVMAANTEVLQKLAESVDRLNKPRAYKFRVTARDEKGNLVEFIATPV